MSPGHSPPETHLQQLPARCSPGRKASSAPPASEMPQGRSLCQSQTTPSVLPRSLSRDCPCRGQPFRLHIPPSWPTSGARIQFSTTITSHKQLLRAQVHGPSLGPMGASLPPGSVSMFQMQRLRHRGQDVCQGLSKQPPCLPPGFLSVNKGAHSPPPLRARCTATAPSGVEGMPPSKARCGGPRQVPC